MHAARGRSPYRSHWRLDPSVAYLNHGSFGACPIAVLARQQALRDRLEAQPVRFLARELEALLDDARAAVAGFVGADPDGLAFVPNATTGVATVLASLRLAPGDELLATTHEYNATLNALGRAAARAGARVVLAPVPFPIADEEAAVAAVLDRVTDRTRLALLSQVTSPTALVLPVRRLVAELAAHGVPTLVDGAHAPGMLPVDAAVLGAAWYTGNGHKWLCAPKGTAFLAADRSALDGLAPLVVSHGSNDTRADRSRFRLEFDWTGTSDPTPHLTLPAAIEWVASVHPEGWPGVRAANHALALLARDRLCELLAIDPPAPDSMLGSMASVPLPLEPTDAAGAAALQRSLAEEDRVEVPITEWPVRAARLAGAPPDAWLVRISAQLYNDEADVDRLVDALARWLRSRPG